jgi:alpha-tubulin suppressor-like RCC1 family protein
MKRAYPILFGIGSFILAVSPLQLSAQCNVNDLYDNIVSGWHQSIAKKSDGTMVVWGNTVANNGSGNILTPFAINSTNYPNLGAATPLRGAIGGMGSSSKSQCILLASDGLYAWGTEDYVVETSLTSSSTFAKIGPTGGGDVTTRLPSGVAPSDIKMMTAFYQTLVLVTNGGSVYVLTQVSANLQGNGAGLANTTWAKVKINSTTDLSNITAVRGQVSSSTKNAMMALSSTGQVYVWGSSVYMADGNGAVSKNYATPLSTMPAEFGVANVPKMIAVTGGGSASNTFFLLSSTGKLYSLGDNTSKQCGDFSGSENKNWTSVKKSGAVIFTDVNYITAMESDNAVPAVAVVTKTGDLYSWGLNEKNMLGRPTDGTTYDPGIPSGFTSGTDKAISAEMGGHTLVYIKEGSTQFCYVGHRINGSMGDGTTADAIETSFNCSGTPVVETCGSVPVAASTVNSVISVSSNLITANGISTSTITIRLKDAFNQFLTKSGGVVIVYTTAGTLGIVEDHNNGTYTVVLTSSNSQETAGITFSINGALANNSSNVVFSSNLPVKWGDVRAFRKYKTQQVEWMTEQEAGVSHFQVERSINGRDWSVVLDKKQAQSGDWAHAYNFIDKDYIPGVVYYRVKEVDLDGKSAYSTVMMIEADPGFNRIIAYPSPTDKVLYVGNIEKSKLSSIILYSINGEKVKSWNQPQDSYDVSGIQAGIYLLKVSTTEGAVQTIRIKKM